eukprot:2929682-Amphidinium_carterae.2
MSSPPAAATTPGMMEQHTHLSRGLSHQNPSALRTPDMGLELDGSRSLNFSGQPLVPVPMLRWADVATLHSRSTSSLMWPPDKLSSLGASPLASLL